MQQISSLFLFVLSCQEWANISQSLLIYRKYEFVFLAWIGFSIFWETSPKTHTDTVSLA